MTRPAGALLLLGLLLGRPAAAQDQGPKFGATFGLNLATLRVSTADVGVRQLFSGGLVAQMDVGGPFAVQSQLLFSQKGAVLIDGENAIRYGASYVDLPLQLRVQGPSLGSVTLHGLVGGFGGLKAFESQRAGRSGLSLSLDTGTSFFRRTNAGLMGGLGGEIPIGTDRRLRLVVQYAQGLTNVARTVEEQPLSVPFPSEAYTRTVSVMLRLGL